jgi:hypothetical protein|tara:strand:- start:3047 stop:3931 length:885 start_codon:yes stop_codon:yes gene_type:complete
MSKVSAYTLKFCLLTGITMLNACDVIDEPVIPVTTNYLESLYGAAPEFDALPAGSAQQRVLVEDFTAHQCGNCPAAAIIAEELAAMHSGLVSVMAVHAGDLANTDDNHFDTDWTTAEGDVFWDQLDFQANPLGRVNRVNGTGAFWAPTQWGEKVAEQLAQSPSIGLQAQYSWEPSNGHLNMHVHGTFYSAVDGPIQIAWLILESDIIDYQLDYATDPAVVPDYEFNHALRGSVHGALGLGFGIASAGAEDGDEAMQSVTLKWDSSWILDNSTIIAVVTDGDGYILNSVEIHPGD